MLVTPIKTHIVNVGDSLFGLLDQYCSQVTDGTVLAITSKVVSICEQRVIAKDQVTDKYALVQVEADAYLPADQSIYNTHLTIKQHRLMPSAGIDESNSNGHYILYPQDAQQSAEKIWQYLRKKVQLKKLGVIITDSHVMPLRRGVTGVAIAWCGFEPIYDYVGSPDIFNETLRITKINILDALATAAVFEMGEGVEQTPLAMITDALRLTFVDRLPTQTEKDLIAISVDEDLFSPLLSNIPWIWKTKS